MKKKSGIVLILGRPNVGKSTFVNTIIGKKISITSPKPQTTRSSIEALYEDERGQLLFVDTPGVFKKAVDTLSRGINKTTINATHQDYDVVLYMVDRTRHRDFEEGRVLGIIREIKKPIFLVINKSDMKESDYISHYRFIESEVTKTFEISALKQQHIKPLISALFEKVHRLYPLVPPDEYTHPGINTDSRHFIEELIREKIYLTTRKEVPYKTGVRVEHVQERKNGMLYIKASVLVVDRRYKGMLIGQGGKKINQIGIMARKELALATDKKVFLDLTVEVEPHLFEIVNI